MCKLPQGRLRYFRPKRKWRSLSKRESAKNREEENEVSLEVDDSDDIKIIGHSRSLMSVVQEHGLKLYKKGWKRLNAKERCFAEL